MTQAKRDVARKLAVLQHARQSRNVSKTCRYFGISRDTYYTWLHAFEQRGGVGLVNRRPGPVKNLKRQVPPAVEEKIVEVRQSLGLGAQRLSWYLARYHGMKVSTGGVQSVLKRHGINRLASLKGVRTPAAFRRYEQRVPGHQVQLDVKFCDLQTPDGKRVRRYQYTAIDDATRIRALRIYPKHNQACAIAFVDYVLEQFPFRVRQIRTDRGHKFQALFHWHVEDRGIEHVYIRAPTPRLNGKVERSHRTDEEEFYQLIEYTSDVDLGEKLAAWERFYNLTRPHTAHRGKTPYEALRERLSSTSNRQARS